MKRKITLFVTIILLPLIIFNGYKFKVYNDFRSYLNKNYSDKTFNIHWVKYDFLNRRFVSRVHCSNDDTEFAISVYAISKQESINEKYLLEKNKKPINSIIYSYLENCDFNTYIQDLIARAEDEQILDTNIKIDYNKLVYNVFVQYKYNSITDHQHFAEISYKIINELKNNSVKLNMISFDYEKDKKVYSLLLQGDDINGQIIDINKSIKRRK